MARPSPGVQRVVTVLEFLAAHPDRRFTLSEISRGCSLNKATAHSLLTELSAAGVLLRHPDEKRYSLGPKLVCIGQAAEHGYQGRDFREGPLRCLAEATGTVAVAASMGSAPDQAQIIDWAGSGAGLPLPAEWLLAPPNGAVFMAWADTAQVEAWLARSPVMDVVGHAVEALEATRRMGVSIGLSVAPWRQLLSVASIALPTPGSRGVAPGRAELREVLAELAMARPLLTSIDDHAIYDVAYVAAPVFDVRGSVSLALAVGWPEGRRCSTGDLQQLRDLVATAADGITEATHGRRPPLTVA